MALLVYDCVFEERSILTGPLNILMLQPFLSLGGTGGKDNNFPLPGGFQVSFDYFQGCVTRELRGA